MFRFSLLISAAEKSTHMYVIYFFKYLIRLNKLTILKISPIDFLPPKTLTLSYILCYNVDILQNYRT